MIDRDTPPGTVVFVVDWFWRVHECRLIDPKFSEDRMRVVRKDLVIEAPAKAIFSTREEAEEIVGVLRIQES